MGKSNENDIFNIPNQITFARLVLSIVVFVLIPLGMYLPALIVFVIAAGTDWVDGWWARKFDQVSKLGRMFDPFVDKFLICGVFIFLCAAPNTGKFPYTPDSGVAAWMTAVVVGRELLVTAMRGFIEQSGGDFSAKFMGKLKMVFQCVAVGASLVALKWFAENTEPLPQWIYYTLHGSVILAIASTINSGLEYIFAAIRMIRADPPAAE